MSWRMIGKPILTADLPNAVFQRFRHPTKHVLVAGIQVPILLYNDPVFTNLELRIYSDSASSPKKLIATSTNVWTKAQLLEVQDHAIKFVGFSFDGVFLNSAEYYHLVLYPNGYTGTNASHIAWKSTYPDPQYRTGLTLQAANGDNHPLEFSIIGETIATT